MIEMIGSFLIFRGEFSFSRGKWRKGAEFTVCGIKIKKYKIFYKIF